MCALLGVSYKSHKSFQTYSMIQYVLNAFSNFSRTSGSWRLTSTAAYQQFRYFTSNDRVAVCTLCSAIDIYHEGN